MNDDKSLRLFTILVIILLLIAGIGFSWWFALFGYLWTGFIIGLLVLEEYSWKLPIMILLWSLLITSEDLRDWWIEL